MFVKPGPNPAGGLLKIRDPITKAFLPDEGTEVPDLDLYWVRLLNDGDVVLATPTQE